MIRSFCNQFSLNNLMILKKLYSLSRSLKPKDPSGKSTVILLTSNGKDKLNNTVNNRSWLFVWWILNKMLFTAARCQDQGFKTAAKLPSIAVQESRSLWGEKNCTFSQTQPVNMSMLYTVCYITFSLHKAAFSSTNKHCRCPYSRSQTSCARRVHCV